MLRSARPGGVFLRMAAEFSPGDKVIAKGKVGTLVKFASSWWTVELDAGGVVKSRAGGLAPATPGAAAAAKAVSPPTAAAAMVSSPLAKSESPKKGTGTTQRKTMPKTRAKAAVKTAGKRAGTSPPKKANMSPALQRVLDAKSPDPSSSIPESVAAYPGALADLFDASESGAGAKSGAAVRKAAKYPDALERILDPKTGAESDDSAVAYPDALAEVLDATEGKKTKGAAKGGKKTAAAAYPAALALVLELSEQYSPTGGSAAGGTVVRYPAPLSAMLEAMEAGVQPARGSSKNPATKKSAATKLSSTAASKSRSKSRVRYPAVLERYLELAATTTAPTTAAPAAPAQKPKRASYPEVLANILRLAEGTSARTARKAAPAKSAAKTVPTSKTKSTAKTAPTSKTAAKPKSAKYPPVLAELLEAAKNTENLGELEQELQEAGTFLAKYPDALATYLDLVEMSTVPPSVPPPKRAAYPVILAEALGLGLNTDLPSGDDLTSQLLSEAQFTDDDTLESAGTPSSASAVYPEGLSRVLDAASAAPQPLDETSVGYPAALADVLDLSEGTFDGGALEGTFDGGALDMAQPTVSAYPEALANVLDLSAGPTDGPTEDVPVAYPAALPDLILDAAEASVVEDDEQQEGEKAEVEDRGIFDIFARFDEIAAKFSKKFGL